MNFIELAETGKNFFKLAKTCQKHSMLYGKKARTLEGMWREHPEIISSNNGKETSAPIS